MDGVLVVDKPSGKTSHDIVDIVRRAAHMKKVGHTGTLDPMATGVLVLTLGRATRIGRFLGLEPKEYLAEALFGVVTDTQDITGRVLSESTGKVSIDDVRALLPGFTGDIMQIPPMVSAVKVGGKPLYKLARQGKEIERAERPVTIYELELLEFFESDEKTRARFRVVCSGGTYVRTLIHDIGQALGVGATLAALQRTRVGKYTLTGAINMEEIAAGMISERVISMDNALDHLQEIVVLDRAIGLILNGREIDAGALESRPGTANTGDYVRIKSPDGSLLALGEIRSIDTFRVKPEIVFN